MPTIVIDALLEPRLLGGFLADQLGVFRSLLFMLVLTWAWASAQRRIAAEVGALVFAVLACGYWSESLPRPWGALVDWDATARLARISMAAEGNPSAALLGGQAPSPSLVGRLVAGGLPAGLLVRAHHYAPALYLLAALLLVRVLAPAGLARAVSMVLVAGVAWSDADLVAGRALGPRAWSDPWPAFLGVAAFGCGLLGHHRSRHAVVAALAPLPLLAFGTTQGGGAWGAIAAAGQLLPFLAWTWIGGGTLSTLAPVFACLLAIAVGAPFDGTAAGIAARLLAIHLAGPAVEASALRLMQSLGSALGPAGWRGSPLPLVVVLVASTGSVFWWRPVDPVTTASAEPLAPRLAREVRALAAVVPAGDVVAAGDDSAPYVLVFAGRPVLRVPRLLATDDDEARRYVVSGLVAGRPRPTLVARFEVRWLVAMPGEFQDLGLRDMGALGRTAGLQRVGAPGELVDVFRVEGTSRRRQR